MTEWLPVSGLRELERALTLQLDRSLSAAEERVAELGFLAELLQRADPPTAWVPPTDLPEEQRWPERPVLPRVERRRYDELRPAGAPSSHELVRRYGGWTKACRAAFGLQPDGRSSGPGKPWRSAWARQHRYTREEAVACLRMCAHALQRRPTSNDYYRWRRAQQPRLRAAGSPQRIATLDVLYRHFKSWSQALAAAAITDAELAAARQATGPSGSVPPADSPREAVGLLPNKQLQQLGRDDQAIERLRSDGFGHLNLSQAAALAATLGGSLDWLAERAAEPGVRSAPDVRFDGQRFKEQRRSRAIPEAAVRELLDLPLGPYRALLKGSWEPTLGMVRTLADLLDVVASVEVV